MYMYLYLVYEQKQLAFSLYRLPTPTQPSTLHCTPSSALHIPFHIVSSTLFYNLHPHSPSTLPVHILFPHFFHISSKLLFNTFHISPALYIPFHTYLVIHIFHLPLVPFQCHPYPPPLPSTHPHSFTQETR